jgi:peptide chain release factor subunit 1
MAETPASPRGLVTTSLAHSRLRQLAEVQPAEGRVLSVYMDLDPSEFGTPPARASQITSLVTDARHRVDELDDLSHDERKALRADVEAVRDVLSQPGIADAGARGVAVFACSPAGLRETVRVPFPLAAKVVIDRTPFVEPLLAAKDAERWCVLLANRRSARFFLGVPPDLEETDRVVDNVHSQHRQGGWSQPRYERSIEEDVRDHLEHVAAVAFDRLKAREFDRLLVGAPQETVGELEGRLHPYLRERLEGQVRLDVENASTEDVRRAAAEKVAGLEREREAEALERLRGRIGSGTRAAAGLDEVASALAEARVETLLLADGVEAGEAIEKALEGGADVMVIRHHADDLGPLGGIAALLRY